MPKLLIVTRSHRPRGGADRIVVDLFEGLERHGWSVRIAVTEGARFNRASHFREAFPGIPVVVLDGTLGTRRSRIEAIRREIERSRPDVVLSMRVFDVVEAVARSVASPRLVYGVRALEAGYIHDVSLFGANIDACVTSGELIARLLGRVAAFPEERVFSIGGGVRSPVRAHEDAHSGSPIRVIYAGRLEAKQKRVLDVADVADALCAQGVAFTLDVVGSGSAEEALRERMGPLVNSGVVRFHGWRELDELYETFYPQADVMLHTAAWEGITIAPREAMAHGVVPVISTFPGLRAEGVFVHERNSLLFPVGEPLVAAAAIARLATDPVLRRALASEARESQRGARSFDGALRAWAFALDSCLGLPLRRGTARSELDDDRRGRLARLRLPAPVEDCVRRMLQRPVRHASPGSEWPTTSGLCADDVQSEIESIARQLDTE